MSRRRCPQGTCKDELRRGGKSAACTVCGDVFPCEHECRHYDCKMVRGEPVPQAVNYVTFAPPTVAEMLGLEDK